MRTSSARHPRPARPNALLAARSAPRRSLAALHVSLAVLTGFLVSVVLVTGSEAGKALVDEHFGLLRFAAYGAWAVGIAAFALAPILLVKDLGIMNGFQLRTLKDAVNDAGGRHLVRAFGLGALGNALVLALSPIGLWLGLDYTWDVFRIHLVASTVIVALSSGSALVRVRTLLEELAFVPSTKRVGHVEPTGI
jgi:hypothetical protein